MHGRPIPVSLFLESLKKWTAAFESGRLEDADRAAYEAAELGVMLAADPEFCALYRRCRRATDPEDPGAALDAMRAMLRAVNETSVPGAYRSDAIRH